MKHKKMQIKLVGSCVLHFCKIVVCTLVMLPAFVYAQPATQGITDGNAQTRFRQAYEAYGNMQWQPPKQGATTIQGQNIQSMLDKMQGRHGTGDNAKLADFNMLSVAEVNAQPAIEKAELDAFLDWWPQFARLAQHSGGTVGHMQKIVTDNNWNWPRFYTIWMRLIAHKTRQTVTRMDNSTAARLQQQKQLIMQNRTLPESQRQMIIRQIEQTVSTTQNRKDTPSIGTNDKELFATNSARIAQVFDTSANLGAN